MSLSPFFRNDEQKKQMAVRKRRRRLKAIKPISYLLQMNEQRRTLFLFFFFFCSLSNTQTSPTSLINDVAINKLCRHTHTHTHTVEWAVALLSVNGLIFFFCKSISVHLSAHVSDCVLFSQFFLSLFFFFGIVETNVSVGDDHPGNCGCQLSTGQQPISVNDGPFIVTSVSWINKPKEEKLTGRFRDLKRRSPLMIFWRLHSAKILFTRRRRARGVFIARLVLHKIKISRMAENGCKVSKVSVLVCVCVCVCVRALTTNFKTKLSTKRGTNS